MLLKKRSTRSNLSSTNLDRGKRRQRLFWLVAISSLFLLSLFAFRYLSENFLKINSVTCTYGSAPCPEIVSGLLAEYKGKSVMSLDRKRLTKDLLSTGLVESVNLKITNGQLILNLTPTIPDIFLNTIFTVTPPSFNLNPATDSARRDLLAEAKLFLSTNSAQLQSISSSGNLTPSVSSASSSVYLIESVLPSRDEAKNILSWIKEIHSRNYTQSLILFLPPDLYLLSSDQPAIIFDINKNILESFSALQSLLQLDTIRPSSILDFRFNHPILK